MCHLDKIVVLYIPPFPMDSLQRDLPEIINRRHVVYVTDAPTVTTGCRNQGR